jgi:hypothetical protein
MLKFKFKPIFRKKFAVVLLIAIVLATGINVILQHERTIKNEQKINTTKLLSLLRTNNCSNKTLQSISAEKVNPNQVNKSITLLSYRSECLYRLGEWQQVIPVFKQLKRYYSMEGNTSYATLVGSEITGAQYAIAHPIKVEKKSAAPANNAALMQSLKELSGK